MHQPHRHKAEYLQREFRPDGMPKTMLQDGRLQETIRLDGFWDSPDQGRAYPSRRQRVCVSRWRTLPRFLQASTVPPHGSKPLTQGAKRQAPSRRQTLFFSHRGKRASMYPMRERIQAQTCGRSELSPACPIFRQDRHAPPRKA